MSMYHKHSEEENKELNKELGKFKRKAEKLIAHDYYDSVELSEIESATLRLVTNAKTHKDISTFLWNGGVIERTLESVKMKIKEAKKDRC